MINKNSTSDPDLISVGQEIDNQGGFDEIDREYFPTINQGN